MAKIKKSVGEVNGKTMPCLSVGSGTKLFMPTQDLDEALYKAYAEKMEFGKTSNSSWLETFVDDSLDKLKKGIKETPELALSALRTINQITKETQNFYNSKKQTDNDFAEYLLKKMLFPWQQEVFESKSKKKTMLAGRRSGKSYCIVQQALKHCLEKPLEVNGIKKYRQAMIMGLTIEKTASIYWDNIKSAIEQCHISTMKIDNGAYTVYFPNGNTLSLYGNSSKSDREKLRGKDLSFVAIDECQSQHSLLYLYESILEPQLKGTAGEIILAGTAPLSAGTYWEMSILSNEWTHYHATMEDNPSIPNHEKALQEVLESNHWTEDNITFLREYKGVIAYDDNLLMYPSVQYYTEIPSDFHPHYCYIGCDLGYVDKTAIIALLIDDFGDGYVISEWAKDHVDATTIFNQLVAVRDSLKQQYNLAQENIRIVFDINEQNMTQDFYNRGIIEAENAIKFNLEYSRALLNEALASGRIKIKENGPCDTDHKSSVYKFDNEKGIVIYEEDKDVYHEDAMAALRYAYGNYFSLMNQGA